MKHLSENDLHDLAEGGSTASALEHVAGCAECRAELDGLRAVLADLAALPRALAPARDLLPGIHARMDEVKPTQIGLAYNRAQATRALWSLRWPLAAAALLLMIATAVVTRIWTVRSDNGAALAAARPGLLVRHQPVALQSKYEQAIVELEQLVETQRAQLSPTTLRLLEENLRVIDRAIRESRAALEQDPNNPLIHDGLQSAFEQKLNLLRRATAAT